VQGKGDGAAEPPKREPPVRYRRVPDEVLRRATRRVVRGSRAHYASQEAFRNAILDVVRREEPLAVVGGARLRRIALETMGVRLTVHYTERAGVPPPRACPVCGSELQPIRNRTLTGDSVVLGQHCTQCDYWTHRVRRVPVRYLFSGSAARRAVQR
jgi:nucleotide-binding universal stress UspA family protein